MVSTSSEEPTNLINNWVRISEFPAFYRSVTSMSPTETPAHLAAYSDLFDRLLDSALLLDFDTLQITDANPACERLFDTTREELLKLTFTDLAEVSQSDFLHKNIRMAKRRYYPHTFECEWVLPHSNGSPQKALMKISACPLKLSNETEVIQIIAKDITQERELEIKAASYLKKLETLNKKLEDLSTHDEMTKLYNFRHFTFLLKQEHERAKRYGTPYSLIFCDVDHFKHYNDRNGHPAGDEVLRGVAEILKNSCRTVDFPARYGGEEFVILCPQTASENAIHLANRVRETVENHPFAEASHQPLGKLSVSIGIATFPFDGHTAEEILKAADQAVYASKKNGRNRITVTEQTNQMKKAA